MNRTMRIITLAVLSGAVVLSVGLWRRHVSGTAHPPHFVIVRDLSDSVVSSCDCTAALVRRAFARAGAGSTVSVTVTGDAASAGEPKLVASVAVPTTRQALEGRDAALKQREQVAGDLKAVCDQQQQTNVSPIFMAMKRAIEHLQSAGCGTKSDCTVYVQSDLEETSDPQIKAALSHASIDQLVLPQPINNEGIRIVVSGVAETTGEAKTAAGNNRLARADQIRHVWHRLVTNPEQLSFEPYCVMR